MNRIVIDASVTLSWCFPEEQTFASMSVLHRLRMGERALVPAFWAVEVLNTLLVGERRERISATQSRLFWETLEVLNPILDYASMPQVSGPVQAICRDHHLTPYDALYVELAKRSACALATLDQQQRHAAIKLGIICL